MLKLSIFAGLFNLCKADIPMLVFGSGCPEVNGSPRLNAENYLGKWYNIANSPFIFMSSQNTCPWANYSTIQNSEFLKVVNSEIRGPQLMDLGGNRRKTATGKAYSTLGGARWEF